jgi:hypothetical protein
MRLPNAASAFIPPEKLQGYCLNPNHDRGKHKARLFAAILGLTADDADELRDILLQAIQDYDATIEQQDQYGKRYIVDFPLTRNGQTATIHSIWIVRLDELFPRLVSCYILR